MEAVTGRGRGGEGHTYLMKTTRRLALTATAGSIAAAFLLSSAPVSHAETPLRASLRMATDSRAVVDVVGGSGTITVKYLSGKVAGSVRSGGAYTSVPVNARAGWQVMVSDSSRRSATTTAGPANGSLSQLVNKRNRLSASYTPPLVKVEGNLWAQPDAVRGYQLMKVDASKAGISLRIDESYRSYATQSRQYSQIVARLGQTRADQLSARPGFSEHQLGLALDVKASNNQCTQQACFGSTATGRWVAANSWKYGFVLRYSTESNRSITGYSYEPWHLRYLGSVTAATVNRASKPTYERWLGVSAAPSY